MKALLTTKKYRDISYHEVDVYGLVIGGTIFRERMGHRRHC